MNPTRLNEDVLDLFERRERLIAELNEIERQLSTKRKLLINHREVETATHDVFRVTERRSSCGQ